MFKKRTSVAQVEESDNLAPKFDENGLIVVTTLDSQTKEILMIGYMNEESLTKSIETKDCLLYTSPSPRDESTSRMPSSA